MSDPLQRDRDSENGACAAHEPAVDRRNASDGVTAGSQLPSAAVTIAMLSASYYFNVLIIIDVILVMIYENDSGRVDLIRNWDALLVGQIIGQIIFGVLCDHVGRKASLYASAAVLLAGAVLCTAASGVHGISGLLWFMTIARGIIGVV
ncbi:uncharacterized protein C8Q71DRAFT_494313 [Rhodofomes roseus]|uniref:Major facilitator superfamily (MFS) profile domain-containing protein n=1 Tax=Rhodofomes roseus TaxID=34475 RepID=A0ABQ8KMU4_9APHY|nr:uncharacterized protein C8Q71DRAFT_494313 [Rhodofomes roseus]KAH9839077.1 hypothetical protein C8Q71DRAFT_494313 [Rhodofomes roseus]